MFDSGRIPTLFSVVFIQILCTTFSLSEKLIYEQSNSSPFVEKEQGALFVPEIANISCSGQKNFCEHIEGYPEVYVETELREKVEKYKYMLWVDGEDDNDKSTKMDDGEFFCATKSQLKFPKIALNTRNQWKFIYNNDKHRQGVRVVYCQREESACIVSPRFKTVCKQIFVDRSMLTISYNGTLEVDTFNQPVTCCCSVKNFSSSNSFWN